jgi:site-specific recombinase XerD
MNELTIINNKSIQIKNTAWDSLSTESRSAYSFDYKLFFEYIKKNPSDVTAHDILQYIEHLEKNNYKNSSINRKICSISKMFGILKIVGEIKENPVEALRQFKNISYKTQRSINIGITFEDIKKTITDPQNIQEKKISLIIQMLAMTGLRISEFINIKNSDIIDFDEENKTIKVKGKGNKERTIYIDNNFLNEIKNIYPEKNDYLFYTIRGNKYDRKVLWGQINKLFRQKINKDVHPHLLRHFFATYKINVEKQDIKAVSKFLGHSDIAITLNFYVDTALDVNSSKIKF